MKKIIIGFAAAAVGAAMAVTLVANAQTSDSTSTSGTSGQTASRTHQPMVLQVGPGGRALIRGTVASASNGSLTVNGWGGVWTINVPSSASVYPAAANGSVADFQPGDFIGAEGAVDTSASWTINATLIRDWTMRKTVNAQEQQNRTQVKQLMNERPRVYVGTASNVSATSLILTSKSGTAYTVNIEAGAKILNRSWTSISVTSIQSGNTVRVYGINSRGMISATVVRDITL